MSTQPLSCLSNLYVANLENHQCLSSASRDCNLFGLSGSFKVLAVTSSQGLNHGYSSKFLNKSHDPGWPQTCYVTRDVLVLQISASAAGIINLLYHVQQRCLVWKVFFHFVAVCSTRDWTWCFTHPRQAQLYPWAISPAHVLLMTFRFSSVCH